MQRKPRVNSQIRLPEVRLIDQNGRQVGIVPTHQALQIAQEQGLDLVEVAAKARPPVCRIMDFGKYFYQRKKKVKHKKQKTSEVKGIRISFKTAQHDLETKAKQAEKFLEAGHKVKIETILRGREKAFQELAKKKIEQFISLIPKEITIEQEPKKYPRGLTMIIRKS